MQTIYQFLDSFKEEIPEWLANFTAESTFSADHFFNSRTVFYPGVGTDGHAVKVFGSTHTAHCFVLADYMLQRNNVVEALDHPQHSFAGYKSLFRTNLEEHQLTPRGWQSHLMPHDFQDAYGRTINPGGFARTKSNPYAILEILAREPEYGHSHGPERLAILYLGADAVATYDALYCQGNALAPFAILIQDHGFGGQYTSFGNQGLLRKLASRCNVLPNWLLVAETSEPWYGYAKCSDVEHDRGGMHNQQRYLYKKLN